MTGSLCDRLRAREGERAGEEVPEKLKEAKGVRKSRGLALPMDIKCRRCMSCGCHNLKLVHSESVRLLACCLYMLLYAHY